MIRLPPSLPANVCHRPCIAVGHLFNRKHSRPLGHLRGWFISDKRCHAGSKKARKKTKHHVGFSDGGTSGTSTDGHFSVGRGKDRRNGDAETCREVEIEEN